MKCSNPEPESAPGGERNPRTLNREARRETLVRAPGPGRLKQEGLGLGAWAWAWGLEAKQEGLGA